MLLTGPFMRCEEFLLKVKEFVERTGITCDVDFCSETDGLDPERATTVFRIFQETLTNIVRHAEATSVKASLEEVNNTLIMKVTDNGIGITKEQISDPKTFGLMGIQERAHLWGGKVAIFGTADKGTTVKVIIAVAKSLIKGPADFSQNTKGERL